MAENWLPPPSPPPTISNTVAESKNDTLCLFHQQQRRLTRKTTKDVSRRKTAISNIQKHVFQVPNKEQMLAHMQHASEHGIDPTTRKSIHAQIPRYRVA